MQNNKILQISSLGSADKSNLEITNAIRNVYNPGGNRTGVPIDTNPVITSWDNSPNNPIIQGFQGLFSNPTKAFDTPQFQNLLFDVDNGVKGQAGIFRTMQDGLTNFGADVDGKPLYTMSSIKEDQNYDLGKNKLYTAGTMMQQFGAFSDEEEADKFAAFTQNAGDPKFMGAITGLSATGDKKGAVNLIMKEFGYPDLDSLDTYEDKKRAYGTAFAAYNYVENAEKMSPAQQSLTLSTMGMMSYKFKDGSTLQDRALVKGPNGESKFNLGEAFSLAGTGADVFSMQKNWDQLDVVQKLTFGSGTPSQLAATGKRMMLLGDPSMGGSAVRQSEADLGRLGFTSVPSAGMGAITGNADALPSDYEVIGAGTKQGQVIAVPKGLSFSAGTINGATEVRSLNRADGIKPASIGAFKTHANWLPNKSKGNLTGTSFGAGIGQSGMLQDPYLKSAMVTTSVMGNLVQRPSDKDVGKAVRYKATEMGANIATAGVYGKVKKGVDMVTGGKGTELVNKAQEINDKVNPLASATDKVTGKVLTKGFGLLDGGFGGGKSDEQQGRDSARSLVKDITDGNWGLQLSDGTFADIGTDGKGGLHEFRFKEKDPNAVDRSLYAYDVDYTNDLDASAQMMTSALMRMTAGGKGTAIDQISGQLANASLGKIGFGQDMTEENFGYVRDNVRGWFFKKGIQTKEDAYALANQMFSEGRATEMDTIAMHQGINMVFDEDAFGTAQVLMAGRWKGLEVAGEIDKAPGPNYEIDAPPVPRPTGQEIEEAGDILQPQKTGLTMNPGTYGGNSNTDIFTKSIIKYQDPARMRRGV